MHKRLGTVHKITMSGSSQATAAFGSQTYKVRLATGAQPAWFLIDSGTPSATTANSHWFPVSWAEDFDCTPGQKCAVIQGGTAGDITITELS